MKNSKRLIPFLLSAITLAAIACGPEDDKTPPMANGKPNTYVVTPSAPQKDADWPTLIVTTTDDDNVQPVVKTGTVSKYVLSMTICAKGGPLTLNLMRLAIDSTDGALFLTDGTPVFKDVMVGRADETSPLLGPANCRNTSDCRDDSDDMPNVQYTLYGANGRPLALAKGQCEDLWVSFTTSATQSDDVIGHDYYVAINDCCTNGTADIQYYDGNKRISFKVTA